MASKTPVSIATAKAALLEADRARIAEEYGDLVRRREEAEIRVNRELGCRADRIKELEGIISGWFSDQPAHAACVAESANYLVEVGPREQRREIDLNVKRAFFKAIKSKMKDPLEAFDVTLKTIEALMGTDFLEGLVQKQRTGPRKLKAVMKSPTATPTAMAA